MAIVVASNNLFNMTACLSRAAVLGLLACCDVLLLLSLLL